MVPAEPVHQERRFLSNLLPSLGRSLHHLEAGRLRSMYRVQCRAYSGACTPETWIVMHMQQTPLHLC